HAAEYGFVMRYPKHKQEVTKIIYEPWHYRYVGKEHAAKMNELDMCLEEYVEYLGIEF
ncbi:MAG: D-alanyl-D-alanine carboxypeptidase family protein, partial [Clostridia bacterium]|nr:D-alanyl-D-alanine carboxypeptidase family protein [Clostridia bacterium]